MNAENEEIKDYKYWLPDEKGERKEIITKNNAVIIIGANGSGKSKLGAWIEKKWFRRCAQNWSTAKPKL